MVPRMSSISSLYSDGPPGWECTRRASHWRLGRGVLPSARPRTSVVSPRLKSGPSERDDRDGKYKCNMKVIKKKKKTRCVN